MYKNIALSNNFHLSFGILFKKAFTYRSILLIMFKFVDLFFL